MTPLTTIVLCNDEIAIPALLTLAFHNQLKAVGVPVRNIELINNLKQLLPPGILLRGLKKTDWKENVKLFFAETGASVGFLMTFPWQLDLETISLPVKGFYNFHYGSLPEYRGSDPLFYQIRNQETHAGLTVHQVEERMDEGRILLMERIKMHKSMTYGSLKAKLSVLGSTMVTKCMDIFSYSQNPITRPQEETKATWFNKPQAKDVMIDWEQMDADTIIALINACNPWNKGAAALVNGLGIKILEVEKLESASIKNLIAGQINFLNSGMPVVACSDGYLLALNIIYTPEGFMSGSRLKEFGVKQDDFFAKNY